MSVLLTLLAVLSLLAFVTAILSRHEAGVDAMSTGWIMARWRQDYCGKDGLR